MTASQTPSRPFNQSCTTFFFPPSLLRICLAKNVFEVEKQVAIPCCKVRTVWRVLENFPLEMFALPLSSSSCRLILPFWNNWQLFLTFSSFVAPLRYTSKLCLWIFSKRIILAFKNPKPLPNFRISGFSISPATTTTNEEENYVTVMHGTHRKRLACTGSARVTCAAAIHENFLPLVRVTYLENWSYCSSRS